MLFRVTVDTILGDDGESAARPRYEAEVASDDKRRQSAAVGRQDQENRLPGKYAAELLTGKCGLMCVYTDRERDRWHWVLK